MAVSELSPAAAFSSIVNVDLAETFTRVRNTLCNEKDRFGFDFFKKHSMLIKALQELVAAAPESLDDEERLQSERRSAEDFVSDVCVPLLHSFAPSFDGRADLVAAVLNVCDLILVCLKRSSHETTFRLLELCQKSLAAFRQNECLKHSDSLCAHTLDIICALELLCSVLEVPMTLQTNQNEDLYDSIFSAALSVLSHLEEKSVSRVISGVIIKLIQQQVRKGTIYLQEIWKMIEADVRLHQEKMPPRTVQQHLSMMCSMANFFFPLTGEAVNPDLRQQQAFWQIVQLGLYDSNPAIRKRSMYLLKRIVDTCEKSVSDCSPTVSSDSPSGSLATPDPYFRWIKQHQPSLSKIWEDLILLLETLDEKQTHVIKPILPRMQSLISASKKKNGLMLLHTSWIVTLLIRAFHHESIYIIRWATETVLLMDFASVPFMEQGQLQFLTQRLLGVLQDLKLFQRPDGFPVGSISSVGAGLKQFFARVCESLICKEHKVEFVQNVLCTLGTENWSSVPLVFITQGLSCIQPDAILDSSTLASVRAIIIASLTTLETFTRGAIECFMTKTVLNIVDKDVVSVEELMETLGVMEREESLKRGTSLWSTVVTWLLTTAADPVFPAWTWQGLSATLHTLIDAYLSVSVGMSGSVVAESLRVTKLARMVMLMADCEAMRLEQPAHTAGNAGMTSSAAKPLLTNTLGKAVEVINTINKRAYMSPLKADRAIYLLLSCTKELGKDKEGKSDGERMELRRFVHCCWPEMLLYIARRTLTTEHDSELDFVDLDLVMFYADSVKTMGELLLSDKGVQSLDRLLDSCSNVIAAAASPLQHVAAVSYMASVAQVIEMKLKTSIGYSCTGQPENTQQLLTKLHAVFSGVSLSCDIVASSRGKGTSAHQGRQVCQYMMSQWQCLRILLSSQPSGLPPLTILEAGLEAFSVSSGESDIPIMQCLEVVIPHLIEETKVEDKLIKVMDVAWTKVFEEIKSWSFWLKMEAFVHMVLQHPLLQQTSSQTSVLGDYMTQVLQRFFEVGSDKSGLLNLVMARLCQLWTGPEGASLAIIMVPTIVNACVFGTLHKKTERLWLDVCMYINTLKDGCSVNEILSSSSKDDLYVRLMAINFLSTLQPDVTDHKKLAKAVLREAWTRYSALVQLPTFRQYTNTQPHRQKHRLMQLFPLLDQFIDQESCYQFCKDVWEGLVLECHPSVRQNLEWLVMRQVQRHPQQLLPSLWQYFDQFSDKRNVSLLSLLYIITRLGPELPVDMREDYYLKAIPLVVPWTMAQHFNTRLYGQAAMYQLWTQCQQMQLQGGQFHIVESCMKFLTDNGNSSAVLDKLLDNYFYSHFHFLQDYSMETLLYTLPRLSCVSDDEWMHPDLFYQLDCSWQTASHFHLLPLYNESKALAACEPGPWKMKAAVESGEEVCGQAEGDVQKKIIPWRLMTPDSEAEQEYSYRKKGRNTDGLVLVTSLINKVPNLGGLCRTSEIFGVSEFVISNLAYLNDRLFQSLSVTAEKWLPITEVPAFRLSDFLEEKKRESYTLVGVEQTANSVDLTKYRFPKKTLLVLGNEKEGIPPDLLQLLDVCVEIPQQGIIRSLNVHVSGALLVWEYTRQQMDAEQ